MYSNECFFPHNHFLSLSGIATGSYSELKHKHFRFLNGIVTHAGKTTRSNLRAITNHKINARVFKVVKIKNKH